MNLEHRVKWAERTDRDISPLEFFKANYGPNTSRSQLARDDYSLYRSLLRKQLLDDAIPHFNQEASERGKVSGRKKKRTISGDPLVYYLSNFKGTPRGKLSKIDPYLYICLWRKGLLGHVPKAPTRFGSDPLAYYHAHYADLTRRELRENDSSFYKCLWRKGLLGHVPKAPGKFGDDPVAYYTEHYPSLTRGELAKENPSLYQRLYRENLLHNVPLKQS